MRSFLWHENSSSLPILELYSLISFSWALFLLGRRMCIDTDNDGGRWDSREWSERSSSDNHARCEEADWCYWNDEEDGMLFDWESVESTVQEANKQDNREKPVRIEIHTLIDSPKVKSWMTCFMSPSWGWFAAECVETWKLPGTRLMLNEALMRHPTPLFSGVFKVLSMKPTSCRPRSSWMSMPITKPNKIKTRNNTCSSSHIDKRCSAHWCRCELEYGQQCRSQAYRRTIHCH